MAKTVTVTISDDPAEKPVVEFIGDWIGRDILIAEASMRRGYRLRKRDLLRGGYHGGSSGEGGSSSRTGSDGTGTEADGSRVVAVSAGTEDEG
jgi:hypothetical protein